MNPCYPPQAVQCVRLLQKTDESSANLFTDSTNSTVAASLTMLIQTASYIEDIVHCSPHLEDVQLVVIARRKQLSVRDADGGPSQVVLWNSAMNARSANEGRPSVATSNHVQQAPLDEQTSFDAYRPATLETPDGEGPSLSLSGDVPRAPRVGRCYTVPIDVAMTCMSLLLQGSGFATHRTHVETMAFAKLSSRLMAEPIRRVFKERFGSAAISETTQSEEPVNHAQVPTTGSTTPRRNSYRELLPEPFRESVRVILPILDVRSPNKVIKMFERDLVLNVGKPDRMRKDHSYSMLCLMLAHAPKDGACARVLKKYAQEGLGAAGCRRRTEFSTATISQCGGPTRCRVRLRPLCRLKITVGEHVEYVGAGRINVLQRDIGGEPIAENSILVHFASTDEAAIDRACEKAQAIGLDLSTTLDTLRAIEPGGAIEWPLSGVSRVTLLNDLSKVVGTAILVDDRVMSELKEETPRKRTRGEEVESSTVENLENEVGNYVIVCDVRLGDNETNQGCAYRYRDCYAMRQFKILKWVHFDEGEPPRTLRNAQKLLVRSLLWHRQFVVPLEHAIRKEGE